MRYDTINPELFKLNRARFARKMQPDSIAIFHSNDRMPRNGDAFYTWRQNSDLFYLSGLDQEETVVVLFPDCIKEGLQEVAFIKRNDDRTPARNRHLYSKATAQKVSGIDRIYWLEDMEYLLHELILLAKRIYINTNENDGFTSEVLSRDVRFAKQLMERYPAHKYHRSQPILKKLAMIKSTYEVELMQDAIAITGKAFARVLEVVKPGVAEYEIEAEITRELLRQRANGHAFEPTVASGADTCVLNYTKNDKICEEGDLLLLDFGAEYANYASDISRTIPVTGQFTPRQRAVYEAVLNILKKSTSMLVPGVTLEEYDREVGRMMESALLDLKILDKTDIKNQNPEQPAYRQYFMHDAAHHIGLDVHGLANRYAPLQAGMVFSCQPGIYMPAEEIGIRLENTILVTDNEPIDLMGNIPIEAEAIEELMNAGVLQ